MCTIKVDRKRYWSNLTSGAQFDLQNFTATCRQSTGTKNTLASVQSIADCVTDWTGIC